MHLIQRIQNELVADSLDGWLFFDFRNTNILMRRILKLPESQVLTRRYLYYVPSIGEPVKIVHQIEAGNLDTLPGDKRTYSSWQDYEMAIHHTLPRGSRIAMEFSPRNAIPYISRVDAGTIDLIREFGVEVVSSADLVQLFEAVWDDYKWETHKRASKLVIEVKDEAFSFIKKKISAKAKITECDVQQFILKKFDEKGLFTGHSPIVAVNENSGNPHYEPKIDKHSEIKENDFVLIDLWAKTKEKGSVFADYTWSGFVGKEVPEEYSKIFEIVAGARDTAVEFLKSQFDKGQFIAGWEVDRITRKYIIEHGYGNFFIHRTGHSIGEEEHGNGANIDDLENHDTRQILPQTCFSIEPGIYLDKFGIRTEINIFITKDREVIETGLPKQTEILKILS